MANTRELIGDEATINGLLEDTLETFEDQDVTKVSREAFYKRESLVDVRLPSCKTVGYGAFDSCYGLQTLLVSGGVYLTDGFGYCHALRHVIIDGEDMARQGYSANKATFNSTPIARYDGAIYVPDSMVDSYKADAGWNQYIILPRSAYPATKFETVSDTWDQIAAASDDGTYDEKYQIGDIKSVFIAGDPNVQGDSGRLYPFVLCAKNADTLASDRSKTANMTWMMAGILYANSYDRRKYDQSTDTWSSATSWEESGVRTSLATRMLPLLESGIRLNVKPVVKYSRAFNDAFYDVETVDSLWIPSIREMCVATSNTSVEQSGPVYSMFSARTLCRRATVNGEGGYGFSGYGWALRSGKENQRLQSVYHDGTVGYEYSSNDVYPNIGFCI